MKTVVYQSFRSFDVPTWLGCCMQTVKAWADLQGFDYRFIDDQLFSYVPSWYKQKVNNDILLMSDFARLALAKELLLQGYDRTVWIDADVIIFDPGRFQINIIEEYAFCGELWIAPGDQGTLTGWRRVNNAVSVFTKPNSFLDFYIHACQSLVRHRTQTNRLDVGTRLLTQLHQLIHFQIVDNVGLFSPIVMVGIAQVNEALLQNYMKAVNSQLYAANLCSSFRNSYCQSIQMEDSLYKAVVNKLLQTQGEIINKHYPLFPVF